MGQGGSVIPVSLEDLDCNTPWTDQSLWKRANYRMSEDEFNAKCLLKKSKMSQFGGGSYQSVNEIPLGACVLLNNKIYKAVAKAPGGIVFESLSDPVAGLSPITKNNLIQWHKTIY